MKQTAVDWLIDMLVTENEITLKGENYKLFDQAKAMEKQQIVDAVDGFPLENRHLDGEQYYNETFKSE
jgi:hypothetical protein